MIDELSARRLELQFIYSFNRARKKTGSGRTKFTGKSAGHDTSEIQFLAWLSVDNGGYFEPGSSNGLNFGVVTVIVTEFITILEDPILVN
jgi:hypothetical protein